MKFENYKNNNLQFIKNFCIMDQKIKLKKLMLTTTCTEIPRCQTKRKNAVCRRACICCYKKFDLDDFGTDHLHNLDYVNKRCQNVPYDSTKNQKENRLTYCCKLLQIF